MNYKELPKEVLDFKGNKYRVINGNDPDLWVRLIPVKKNNTTKQDNK